MMNGYTAIAKVILLGDSGVGKSALATALTRQPYQPTGPASGRKVVTLALGKRPTERVAMWDLDGRPGFRTIQQLNLDAVAAALIVFDARAAEPFDGILYWAQALVLSRARQRESGCLALPMKTHLVAARADDGKIDEKYIYKRLSDTGLADMVRMDTTYLTSAREGRGIGRLRRAINTGIDWAALPASPTSLIEAIQRFLLEERRNGRLVARTDDLWHSYRRARVEGSDSRKKFAAGIELADNMGLIWLMRRSDLVVLLPELVDDYALALLRAERGKPERPSSLSLPQERDLLEATVSELKWRGLIDQQNTGQGTSSASSSPLARLIREPLISAPLFPEPRPDADNEDFDAILSYSTRDIEQVKQIRRRLIERGFRPWMDKYDMQAGISAQKQLRQQINSGKPSVFFIGPHGLGNWQELELEMAALLMSTKKYWLIPVFLDTYVGRADRFEFPGFAGLLHAVDMREDDPDPFEKLVRAIKNGPVPGYDRRPEI
jgi:hypothetical protein